MWHKVIGLKIYNYVDRCNAFKSIMFKFFIMEEILAYWIKFEK